MYRIVPANGANLGFYRKPEEREAEFYILFALVVCIS